MTPRLHNDDGPFLTVVVGYTQMTTSSSSRIVADGYIWTKNGGVVVDRFQVRSKEKAGNVRTQAAAEIDARQLAEAEGNRRIEELRRSYHRKGAA